MRAMLNVHVGCIWPDGRRLPNPHTCYKPWFQLILGHQLIAWTFYKNASTYSIHIAGVDDITHLFKQVL